MAVKVLLLEPLFQVLNFNSSFTNLSFWNKTTGGYQSSNYFPVLTGLGFNFSQPAKTLIPLNN